MFVLVAGYWAWILFISRLLGLDFFFKQAVELGYLLCLPTLWLGPVAGRLAFLF